MASKDTQHSPADSGSIESTLVSAGRERQPGAPLHVPPFPASNFVLGDRHAYARDDGTPGREALEELVGRPRRRLFGGVSIRYGGNRGAFRSTFGGSVIALRGGCYQGVAALADARQRRGRWTVRRTAVANTASGISVRIEAVEDLRPESGPRSGRERLELDAAPSDHAVVQRPHAVSAATAWLATNSLNAVRKIT